MNAQLQDPQLHVVVGAGPVGRALARQLAEAGHRVRVVSRSGAREPDGSAADDRVETAAVDAADPQALLAAVDGAAVLYNAANPRDYHRWSTIWPPLAASILSAAEGSGAVLATVGNLYPYGAVTGPIHEDLPDAASYTNGRVRAAMWSAARAAHDAGRVRVVEVRASDYVGRDVYSHASEAAKAVVLGRTARIVGDPDQPHTWTSTGDTARTLVAAAADPEAHGRTWIVPSNQPRTQRELLSDLAVATGKPMPRIAPVGRRALRMLGLVVGPMRAMADTYYQFDRPFVVDDSRAREHFGIEPRPWPALVEQLVGDRVSLRA